MGFPGLGTFLGFGALPAYATNQGFRNQANSFLFGSEPEFNPYNKESLSALQQLLQGGGLQGNPLYNVGQDYLSQLLSGSSDAYKAFEAPLMENFQQNIAPAIAERFAGLGTGGGASSSSALQNSLAQAGRNLQTDIGTLRANTQLSALPQALQYAQQPIQNRLTAASQIPGQYFEHPGQEGLVQSGLRAFAQGAGRTFSGGL